jgi:hypothetical protein
MPDVLRQFMKIELGHAVAMHEGEAVGLHPGHKDVRVGGAVHQEQIFEIGAGRSCARAINTRHVHVFFTGPS